MSLGSAMVMEAGVGYRRILWRPSLLGRADHLVKFEI